MKPGVARRFLVCVFPVMLCHGEITAKEAIRKARAAVAEAVKNGTAIRKTRGAPQKDFRIPETGVRERCEEAGTRYIVTFDSEQSGTLNGSVLAQVTLVRKTGKIVEVVTYY